MKRVLPEKQHVFYSGAALIYCFAANTTWRHNSRSLSKDHTLYLRRAIIVHHVWSQMTGTYSCYEKKTTGLQLVGSSVLVVTGKFFTIAFTLGR